MLSYKKINKITITNYYTWYSDFQIQSMNDLYNVLKDINEYHNFCRILDIQKKLHKNKPKSEFFKFKKDFFAFCQKYNISQEFIINKMIKSFEFDLVMDEGSIYFNPRSFSTFAGDNTRLLKYIYQPRKIKLRFMVIVQSLGELDVRFRRLATTFREYVRGFWIYKWYVDYFLLDPEEIKPENMQEVGWWPVFGSYVSAYPIYPVLDYETSEILDVWVDVYRPGDIIRLLIWLSVNQSYRRDLDKQNKKDSKWYTRFLWKWKQRLIKEYSFKSIPLIVGDTKEKVNNILKGI